VPVPDALRVVDPLGADIVVEDRADSWVAADRAPDGSRAAAIITAAPDA
jgi:hypothetical protein